MGMSAALDLRGAEWFGKGGEAAESWREESE